MVLAITDTIAVRHRYFYSGVHTMLQDNFRHEGVPEHTVWVYEEPNRGRYEHAVMLGISVDLDDFFAKVNPEVLRDAKVRGPHFDTLLLTFGIGSVSPPPAHVVRWVGSVASVHGLASTQALDVLKSLSFSSISFAWVSCARPSVVVYGEDGQILRGKKKKQFRAAMYKAGADRMVGGMQYHAVGCRADGIGAAQHITDKGVKLEVIEDIGNKSG